MSTTSVELRWEASNKFNYVEYGLSGDDWVTSGNSVEGTAYAIDYARGLSPYTEYKFRIKGTDGAAVLYSNEATAWTFRTEHWSSVTAPVADGYHAIRFFDESHGYAIGSRLGERLMIETLDGGGSWQLRSVWTPNAWIDDVAIVDEEIQVAVGSVVYRTVDGGETWLAQRGLESPGSFVAFPAPTLGVIGGYSGYLLISSDRGETWTQRSPPSQERLFAACFADSLLGIVVGSSGVILITTDGGGSWSNSPSGTQNWLTDVTCSGRQLWLIATWDGSILRSTDGGVNWTASAILPKTRIQHVVFRDPGTAFAITERSHLYCSTDSGASWIPQSLDPLSGAEDVVFPSSTIGIIVGKQIMQTTDGGRD